MTRIMRSERLTDAAIAAALALAQALLVAPLFAGPYTQWRQSIEAAFITDARFMVDHFPDLSWSPLWYLGFPFELFYTPLMQVVTALVGWVSGDVASAYRAVAAAGFALGAGGLYVLARSLGLARATAALATALFACAPLASYALPGLVGDGSTVTGSPVPLPWRLVVLVEYGEGPHVLGLSIALFAAAAVIAYLRERGAVRFWLAAVLVVAVALTNLIAVLGVGVLATMAVLAVGGDEGRIRRGAILGGTIAILCLVWYSPGFIRAVAGFSTPGGEGGGGGYLLFPAVIGAAAIAGRIAGRRHAGVAILVSSGLVFAAILAAWYLRHTAVAPQPIRYALELDAVVAILLALAAGRVVAARPTRAIVISAAAGLVLVASAPGWLAIQPRIAPDRGWESWSERRVALWLRDHLGPGERAYLSGSHAFWADVFADVPQVRGGVDFAGLDPWWAHATYQINTGSDAAVSVRWLRALGVRYAVVTGPDSADAYRDFAKPAMFDGGLLPLAADIDGARIYEVAAPHAAAAPIAQGSDPSPPRDALDGATLDRYLAAIDAGLPGSRVTLRAVGLGGWDGEVRAAEPMTLLLPTAFDTGWRVYLDDRAITTRADTIGLLAADVPAGTWRVRVDHRVHGDLLAGNAAAFGFLAFIAARRAFRTTVGRRALPPAAILGTVVAYAAALGVIVGYPKGTDAPMHLGRMRFVAEWFPQSDWMYSWAAGMPAFDTYPALPYLAAIPFVRTIGAEATLQLFTLAAYAALGLGLYGHLIERGRPRAVALLAALMALSSIAMWTWVATGGAYARLFAIGIGAVAWWTHARALRTDGAPWWAATAALLAAAVASHQAIGAIPALYVAAVHLSARGVRGLPRLAALAATSVLLAAPALVPSLTGGTAAFLGRARAGLEPMRPEMLLSPVHVGLAAFTLPLLALAAAVTSKPWRVLLAGSAFAVALAYAFAPALGLPTQWSYVSGIDPVTTTFVVALVGALVFAAVAPADDQLARTAVALGTVLVLVNAVLGVPAYAAQRDYPRLVDTTAPGSVEDSARRALVVQGDDLRHRMLPFTAYESVWFSDAYRKPMLRHYYDQGVVHPDWLAWAFSAIYAAPTDDTRVRAAADWYALDSLTVPAGLATEAALARIEWLRPVASTLTTPYHQYAIERPSTIVVASSAPIVAVIADRAGYDRVARLLFDDGVTPSTRVPIWWEGTLADLPGDLIDRAASALIVGDRIGPRQAALGVATRMADRGARIVWDLAGVGDGPLAAPWPNATVSGRAIAAFDVRDSAGRITGEAFSPARYGDGAWGAQVMTGATGAVVELGLGDDALIVSAAHGAGAITAIGGNLLYHALTYANASERSYLLGFLGPAAVDAAVEPAWTFVDPERREIRSDTGAVLIAKESFHSNWSAAWLGPSGEERPLPIRYTGPGLMAVVPPGPGSVTLSYGTAPTQTAAWAAAAAGGVSLGVWLVVGRRRRPLSGR